MMDPLGSYILSVVTAAILCALVTAIAGKKTGAGAMIKMLAGLFLTLTVIRPVAQGKVEDFLSFTEALQLEAADTAAVGTAYYQNSLVEGIKERTRTYILDKAQTLNAQVTVDVRLDERNLPYEVAIQGPASREAREALEAWLTTDLAIPKERQIWIESSSG